MKKKILITGGSGLLAINWAHKIKDDYQVILALHQRLISICGIEIININELGKYTAGDIDIVVNTIGLTNVETCEKNPHLAYDTNIKTAINIANFCKVNSIKLVHISTDHLFDGVKSYYSELDKPNPLNVYAKTKLEAERQATSIYPEVLVVRTNFFGNGTNYRKSFSDTILEKLYKNQSITLFDDVFFTPILIDELVKIVHQLIYTKARGVFNIVGTERLSKYEFGMQLAKVFGLNDSLIKSNSIDDKHGLIARPKDMSLSNNKLREKLKYNLPSLKEQFESLKNQVDKKIIF